MSGTDAQGAAAGLSTAASISNRVVQLMSLYTGRGPTKAWTSLDQDPVSAVLRDTLTRGERSLVQDGRSELVLRMRNAYQDTMREELVAAVEELTGRKVARLPQRQPHRTRRGDRIVRARAQLGIRPSR